MKNIFINKKNKIYEEKKANDFRELIDISTSNFGEKTAFTVKDKNNKTLKNISFNDFKNNIRELGTALLDLGLVNKKIAIIAPDRYEWCCSYFAISTSNNIIVPLDYLLPAGELTNLLEESLVDAVIFDSKYETLISEIKSKENSSLKYCICMDYDENKNNIISFSKLLEHGKCLIEHGDLRYDSLRIDKDKLSILIYTSGTTSKPKAVMLSQYNICSNVSAMTTLIKYKENDSILVFLPLHHTLACTASFLFCYYVGFRICFADSIKDIAKNLKEYNISGFVTVPALLEIMYRQIIKGVKKTGKYIPFKILCALSNLLMFFHIDLRRKFFKEVLDTIDPNLRIIIYGSASTDRKVIKLLNTIGIDMLQGYGLTETSPVISCQSDKYHSAIGSCGFPLYNEEVKIDEPDKAGIGEILVKGPNVMLGYYNNKNDTENSFKDGWFCTGDLGKQDLSGNLYVTGRKKDVIVLQNGKKVFPEDLEALLNKIDIIDESMVYESFDSKSSQKICAKIVCLKDNPAIANMDDASLYDAINTKIKELNKSLPVYKYIREFFITNDPLEKTTTQKIKRTEEMKKIKNRM